MRDLPCCVALIMSLFWLAVPARADETRYFRSDSGLGTGAAAKLPDQFDDGSQLVWRIPLAKGHSTPCVYGDAVYLTTYDNGKLFTLALDRATGRQLWSKQAPNTRIEATHATGGPAAATPACDGTRVYSFFGSYGLLCYDLGGALVWSQELGPFQDEFGAASSPILVDGKLLLAEDHDADSYLLCLNATSGELLWKTPREGLRSYSTPVVWTVGGRKIAVVAGALQLTGYDLDSGKPLWTIDGLARIVNTTPVAHGNRLLVATWAPGADREGRIAMDPWLLAARKWDADRDGKITLAETDNKDVLDRFFRIDINQDQGLDEAEWTRYGRVFDLARNSVMALELDDASSTPRISWQYDRGVPYVASPLIYQGVVYLVKDGGIVTSLDFQNGDVGKQARISGTGSYYASPVAGDDNVYLLSEQGVMTVLKAGGKWEVLHSHDFEERSVASPVIDGGQLLIRTEEALYCFGKPQG